MPASLPSNGGLFVFLPSCLPLLTLLYKYWQRRDDLVEVSLNPSFFCGPFFCLILFPSFYCLFRAVVWMIVYYLFHRVLNFWLLGFLIGVLPLWVCSFCVFFLLGFFNSMWFQWLVWLWFLSVMLWCLLLLFSNNWYQHLLQYHDCIICWLGFRIKANCFLVFQFSAIIFLHNCIYDGLWFKHGFNFKSLCKHFYFVLRLCFLIEIYKAAMVWLIVYRLFVRVLNFWLLGFLIRALPLLGLFILSFFIAGFF